MSDGAGRPLHRGLGVLAGVASCGVAGLADGAVAWMRAPPGSLPPQLGALVLAHCAAVLLTFGVILGAAEEFCLAALARVPFMPRFARWCAAGPGRWFTPDPMAFATLLAVALALGVSFGPTFPVAYLVITTFHAMPLAALAVLLVQIASAVLGASLALLLLPLLRGLARGLGPLASPGVFAATAAAGVGAHAVHFVRLNWESFHNLEFAFAAVGLALLLGNAAALLLLGRRVLRAARPVRGGVVLGAAGAAVVAFAVSAVTFGARQTVAATIFNRSVLTQRVARSLQVALDADRDGFSAVFNGGDCNDHNAAVNPRARDIPGNGVDENCSGRDARVEAEAGDGGMVPLPARFGDRPASVVFLSIDAMRPDHMSAYGYRRPTTPNLDRFARAGARFEHTRCASPRSLRSFASIMVGRYASMVAWGNDVQFPPLEESNVTLAEKLRLAGYRTAAMHNTSYFSHTAGYFQGFDTVHEAYGFKAEAQDTVDRIQGFLRERRADGQPFFLWSHLMEPHDPYRDHTAPRDFGHGDIDRYDEEIARADAALAPVLASLEAMARERPVVVFLFADHGEAFGEHGVFHHSFDLHDEALRVPLIVWGTGVAPGPRAALTSLLDLHPTALNLARAPVSGPVSGRSLVPVLADGARRAITFPGWRTRVYGEVTPDGIYPSEQRALTEPPYKLLHDVRRGTWELFDLARDPGELRNLYDERPDLAATLRERLLTWADHASLASNRTQDIIAAARLAAPPRPQHPLGVRFGDLLELIGYDLPADRLRINDAYRAVFYYRVLQRTRSPVVVTVNFEPEDGQPIWPFFRARHHPLGGRYPTTDWRPGEILRDEVSLRVDPEMRPVRLRAFFALEIEANNTRVAPRTGDDGRAQLPLAPIEITP